MSVFEPNRRRFLQVLGGAAAAWSARAAAGKTLAGVFPIGFSPFTPQDKLDTEGLASQVRFCNRTGVHGFVWPQLASGWTTLSDTDRIEGAEAILGAGKGGRTALVIGVQAPEMASIQKYARHAEKLGADAIVALPPTGVNDEKALLDYYQQVGRITALPLFAQAVGAMSVDLLVEMFRSIPTLRHVKDEAGDPLTRIKDIRRRTDDQLRVFSGKGVQTMITEMELGFSGHCPYTNLADVYAAAYDQWHKGEKRAAFDTFGRILAMGSVMPTNTIDILIARGVLKPGTKVRTKSAPAAMSHEEMREKLKTYLPELR